MVNHRDLSQKIKVAVRKYRTTRKTNFAQSSDFFYENQKSEAYIYFTEAGDVLATHVVFVTGTLETYLVSIVQGA